MAPLTWLLSEFGESQTLTQAGYLNRAFVVHVYEHEPWDDGFRRDQPPRSETDDITLHRLRHWLESAGALRKRGKVLHRTTHGTAMTSDPLTAWTTFACAPGPDGWERFVIMQAALILLARGEPVRSEELYEQVTADAAELGWRTNEGRAQRLPSRADVSPAFHTTWRLLELFGFGREHGDWRDAFSLTPAGQSTMLAMLRAEAAGPRRSAMSAAKPKARADVRPRGLGAARRVEWSLWDLWMCVIAVIDHDGNLDDLAGVFVGPIRSRFAVAARAARPSSAIYTICAPGSPLRGSRHRTSPTPQRSPTSASAACPRQGERAGVAGVARAHSSDGRHAEPSTRPSCSLWLLAVVSVRPDTVLRTARAVERKRGLRDEGAIVRHRLTTGSTDGRSRRSTALAPRSSGAVPSVPHRRTGGRRPQRR